MYCYFSIVQSILPFVNGNSSAEEQFDNGITKGMLNYNNMDDSDMSEYFRF